MASGIIGWDIGGAHVKAAYLDGDGSVLAVLQAACPLWRGIHELDRAVPVVLARLAAREPCRHAVTMTGELVDAFTDRRDGVRAIVAAMAHLVGAELSVFAGPHGLLETRSLREEHLDAVASANWLASATFVATQLPEALFVDLGSTTADILLLQDGAVRYRGYNDFERLRQAELVYTGVVRTPVMAVAESVPFDGDMILLAAEHFATMADVYRLSGQLPEHADQWPAADGGEKTAEGSARRLARLLGRDWGGEGLEPWRQVAAYVGECQLEKLHLACLRQLSRGLLDSAAPLVGAGVGRFVLRRLGERLDRPYVDVGDLFNVGPALSDAPRAQSVQIRSRRICTVIELPGDVGVADVAPAVAVAKLARRMSL